MKEMTLGQALRFYINKANLTQADVCRETGLSASRLCNYLQDAREPDWQTLCMIVDTIGVKLDDLRI
ncbi:MAG: helix-turn-helix domain-containing protein [Deferribacterales bacterium]